MIGVIVILALAAAASIGHGIYDSKVWGGRELVGRIAILTSIYFAIAGLIILGDAMGMEFDPSLIRGGYTAGH